MDDYQVTHCSFQCWIFRFKMKILVTEKSFPPSPGGKIVTFCWELWVLLLFYFLWMSVARTPRGKYGLKCKSKYFPNPFGDVNKCNIKWRFCSWLLWMLCTPVSYPEIAMCSRRAKAVRKLVLFMPCNSALPKLIWALYC